MVLNALWGSLSFLLGALGGLLRHRLGAPGCSKTTFKQHSRLKRRFLALLLVLDWICLYCLVLSCRLFSSPVLHCLIFSCLAWPCLALSGLVGRRLGLPCFIWPGLALPRRLLHWYSHLRFSCRSPSRLFSSTLCSRRFT